MLTARQKKFCEEYVACLNATQAATRAGYKEKTARATGHENLTKPDIKKYIYTLQSEIATQNKVTIDDIVKEFKQIKDDNIGNYVDFVKYREGVKMFLKKDLTKKDIRNIQQISLHPSGVIKNIKLYPRDNALEQLGRHIGFFNDHLTIKHNLEEVLKEVSDNNLLSEDHLKRVAELLFEKQKKFINQRL
ncbi:MAG TPA: terminase small subunit [Chitinophagaceae bacterium]|nr:terminase small subunit [Chitinophagaceae bacterium]